MKAVIVNQPGGPERLEYVDLPTPEPQAGEARVRIAAIGVNYIDIYFRTGLYPADRPIRIGMEAAGEVDAIGPGVTHVKPGDRVAYATSRGSYAEYALVPDWQLVPIPEAVSFEQAAAAALQGLTAHYLTHSSFPLQPGHTALIHAAAGGVGLLLVQMAKKLGARVFGTTSTEEKAALARHAGADEVILYTRQDFQAEARRLTGGKGVDVVYDSVGAATWEKSLDSLRHRGMIVSFGNSSGAVPPFSPLVLSQKGSLFLTRPTLAHYCLDRDELLWRARDVFGWVQDGSLALRIDRTLPLAEAAQAHSALAGRETAGKLLLVP